jgi:hypothetical protein
LSLALGTLDDYKAGRYPFTTNPLAPSPSTNGPTQITPPAEAGGPVIIRGQFQEWTPSECACGTLCTAWAHELQTDWWYPFFTADCGGLICYSHPAPGVYNFNNCGNAGPDPQTCPFVIPGTPLSNLCASCWQPFKTDFDQVAADAANDDFGSGALSTTLGNLFPGRWLQAFRFNPGAIAQIDFYAISCASNVQTLELTLEVFPDHHWVICPNGVCPTSSSNSLSGKQKLGFVDPPLPIFRPRFLPREVSVVGRPRPSLTVAQVLRGAAPPSPAALESPAFARPSSGIPLPVHPVLSQASVEGVCGVCGDADAGELAGELEELEL